MGLLITIAGVNTFKLKREGVWCLAYTAVCACVCVRVRVCVCLCDAFIWVKLGTFQS